MSGSSSTAAGSSGESSVVAGSGGIASQVAMVSASGAGPSERGVVVGVVGSMGTASGEGRKGGSVKRKRMDGDGGSGGGEEPGSSLEPPSTKKRHIRLRPRVQVTASTSSVPDTQGSTMETGTVVSVCVCSSSRAVAYV